MSPILVNKLPIRRLTIVGAGLMGGSLARALRPSLDHLALIDANPLTRQAAAGLADLITDDLAEGVAGADMVILATPVRAILRLLTELPAARPDSCLLMDLGSTKTAVCQAMSSLPPTFQAIGGHPMCGKETAGFAAADPHLYQNQTFVLCRNGRTTSHIEQTALAIVAHIGSRPLFLPPDVHDRLVGLSSHLPYLTATALMQTAVAFQDEQVWSVTASGFRDTSRLAGSDPAMMLDILLTNRTAVLEHLQKYGEALTAVQQLLQANDEKALAKWLAAAQSHYQEYKTKKRK